jgi:hypothetical protein
VPQVLQQDLQHQEQLVLQVLQQLLAMLLPLQVVQMPRKQQHRNSSSSSSNRICGSLRPTSMWALV